LFQLQYQRFLQQGHANALGKCLPQQEIAIPGHKKDLTGCGELMQRIDNLGLSLRRIIVSQPYLEQVTQDIKAPGLAGPGVDKFDKCLRNLWPPRIEVAIRDKQVFLTHVLVTGLDF
jgi:hypothetical protein